MAMSQQPMRNHPQHIPGGSPIKRYLSQHQHSDSRLVGVDPAYHSRRRDSGEDHRAHRRRSADPALLFEGPGPISPSFYRRHLAPPRGSAQSQERLHFRHDSVGSSATDEIHFGEEFGSQISLGAPPSRHTSAEQRPPQFEEVGGDDEGGCSQPHPWGEPISHTDIQISISDVHHPTASTLTANTQARSQHHTHHRRQSQEQFLEDEESSRFLAVEHMLGGPTSSQFQYFEDGGHTAPPSSKCDMPSYTSALSQPTVSSKRRLQSSVPDLSILTGTSTSNLAHSQSVLDVSRHSHRGEYTAGVRYGETRVPSRHMSQSYNNHLNRVPSEPNLYNEGVLHPGLARSVLAKLKEEPEFSPATQHRGHKSAALPPKKCYKEARKSRRRKSVSPSPDSPEPQPDRR